MANKFFRQIIGRFERFSRSLFEKKPELASVPYEKIVPWVDKQYKPHFSEHMTELSDLLSEIQTEREKLIGIVTRISKAQVQNKRVDVLTRIMNKKSLLIKELKSLETFLQTANKSMELYEIEQFFERLQEHNNSLTTVREDVNEYLYDVFEDYKHIISIAHNLNKFAHRAIRIFEGSSSYLIAIKTARRISEIGDEEITISQKIKLVDQQMKKTQSEIKLIDHDIDNMEQDPKYKLEKTGIANRTGKYSVSFTDLEIDKKKKSITELEHRLKMLGDHRKALETKFLSLNKNGKEEDLKAQILRDFNIEVEFVERN